MKPLRLAYALLTIALAPLPSLAQNASAASAAASAGLSQATSSVVVGTASTLAAAASLTLMAVEKAGESVVWVLKDLSTGATVSIRASGKAAGTVSMVAGAVITVTASAAGYSLYQAGRLIAFIPSEVGRSLIHHSQLKKTSTEK